MGKINNKEFKKYLINKDDDLKFIQSLRLNKKSISINIDLSLKPFIFNDLFTEKTLYNLIISYLNVYTDIDINFLKYKYSKLNINWK